MPGERDGTIPYWRDVGTLESYFAANMEVRSSLPAVNLYNRQWRIRTAQRDYPPARLVQHSANHPMTSASDSLVCEGSIVSSTTLDAVMLGYDSYIHPGCHIENSVLLSGCDVGEGRAAQTCAVRQELQDRGGQRDRLRHRGRSSAVPLRQ